MSAMDHFKSLSSRGTAAVKSAVEEITTTHKNTVTCIRPMKYDEAWNVLEFSTSGMDGNIAIWKA
ncbi:actin-related protein 3 complex, subunit 1A, putative [Entamoeba histolytica KU27]|nr:actin-related protein 3 complex, subunit 1A, putative [Entamoeba histolytica KU27]